LQTENNLKGGNMPVFIYEKDALEKIAEVEGEEWLRHQKNFGDCSFDAFLQTWNEQIGGRKDLIEKGGSMAISVNGNGAIYGLYGWNRYIVMYSGEIKMLRDMAIQESIEKAEKCGFCIA
jgi:hypothetical protein